MTDLPDSNGLSFVSEGETAELRIVFESLHTNWTSCLDESDDLLPLFRELWGLL